MRCPCYVSINAFISQLLSIYCNVHMSSTTCQDDMRWCKNGQECCFMHKWPLPKIYINSFIWIGLQWFAFFKKSVPRKNLWEIVIRDTYLGGRGCPITSLVARVTSCQLRLHSEGEGKHAEQLLQVGRYKQILFSLINSWLYHSKCRRYIIQPF